MAGDQLGAAACYREALHRQPASLVCYHQLAYQLQACGRSRDALAVLEQGLQLRPEHAALLGLEAAIWVAHGRAAEAEALLRDLAERRPAPAIAIAHLIRLLRGQDRDHELIELLDTLVADEPECGRWRFERTASLIRSGQLAAAEPELAALIASSGDDALVQALQVAMRAHRHDVRGAIALLGEVADRDGAPWVLKQYSLGLSSMDMPEIAARSPLERLRTCTLAEVDGETWKLASAAATVTPFSSTKTSYSPGRTRIMSPSLVASTADWMSAKSPPVPTYQILATLAGATSKIMMSESAIGDDVRSMRNLLLSAPVLP